MVVFYVSTVDGSWTLDHYLYNAQQPDTSLAYVDEANSSAIQQGAGATNRLLVLARGQTYLLYINDRFIRCPGGDPSLQVGGGSRLPFHGRMGVLP